MLTERQLEVVASIMRNGHLKLVAAELGLTIKTIDQHMRNIYKAVGMRRGNLVLLVLRAEREGWIK